VKLNRRILQKVAEFVTATNTSYRQAASPAMHKFILILIQTCVCIQANDHAVFMDPAGILGTMIEKHMAGLIRERETETFAEAMVQLHDICFANSVVDVGTVHSLQSIVCLLINPL
jgi:hypothetical protein